MALTKVTYKDGSTVITAQNLNDIQDEIISQASTKAPVASPNFTGTPKAPTAAAGTNTTQIATTAFVQSAAQTEAANAVSTFVRPNLLDNWYFVGGGSQLGTGTFPINQRGQTIKTGTGYFIDRWRITGYSSTSSELSVEDGFKVTSATSSGASGIRQIFSLPIPSGTEVTVSMMVTLGENATGISVRLYHPDDSYDQIAASDMTVDGELRWGTIILTDTCTDLRLRILPFNSSVAFKAVKVEIGNYQTLAHKENGMWMLNEFPNFGEELLKCQRYFQMFRTEALRPTYGADFRPVMATGEPDLNSFTLNDITYYTANSEP